MIAAVWYPMGSAAASRYRETVRQSKRIMIFFLGNRSAILPPRRAAGRETVPAVAMSMVATPSDKPSLVVSRKVIMGQTKEPMAVTSFPTNKIYISFFNPAYWVRIRCILVFPQQFHIFLHCTTARRKMQWPAAPVLTGSDRRAAIKAGQPERKLRLSGGVCDYTEPATGKSKLFFPVEPAQPAE